MSQTWLLFDVSYLMNRAFHAIKDMEFEGEGSGALFGVIRDIRDMIELLGGNRIVFCFDGGYDYRLSIYPDYKISRRTKHEQATDEEKADRACLYRQIAMMREEVLRDLGYTNVLWQPGYEADDLIAAACHTIHENGNGDDIVIISADGDLWQLINDCTWCYNPVTKKATTIQTFRRDWNIEPTYWAHVKALAGCNGDDIPGIDGIGPKSAAAWYARTLKPGVKYASIVSQLDIHNRNIKLTRLPAPGTMTVKLLDDCCTRDKWNKVVTRLGFKSMIGG